MCVEMYIHVNTFSSFKANADANRLKSSQRMLLLTDKMLSSARLVNPKIAGHFLKNFKQLQIKCSTQLHNISVIL